MENRNDLCIPEKTQLKLFKNVRGVHKYSVNDACFGVFPLSISGLQASTNAWVHFVDSIHFPKVLLTFALALELSEHFFCFWRSRRKHLCRNSVTLYLVVYLYNILLA